MMSVAVVRDTYMPQNLSCDDASGAPQCLIIDSHIVQKFDVLVRAYRIPIC